MNRNVSIALGAVVIALAGIGGGYWFAMHRVMGAAPPSGPDATAAAAPAKKPLYWHDPMHPQQKFDKPGRSPFMDMDLVPVYGEEGDDAPGATISSRMVQNLGVRIAEAKLGTLGGKLEAVGAVAFDDRNVAVVQARVNGFVEKLFARAPLDPVEKGQALVEILAPDWAAAQEEYLALKRSTAANDALRSAARKRLVLAGMPEETIAAMEADGRTRARVTITAPLSGVISELGVREGMTVMAGATLFRINGISTVWVNAEIPESQAGRVMPGARVEATVPAYPGEKFAGRVTAILPEVNAATRTVKTRVELANPGTKLKPGMYATIDFAARERREALLVPSEAVIRTGQRNVVVVADTAQDGKQQFRAVDVEVGAEGDAMTEIRSGLAAGTKVVTSGQFLIDSEASLKAGGARLSDAPANGLHRGAGKVEHIGHHTVTLSHGPIASLQWGEMTMDFTMPKSGMPASVKAGDRVDFEFRKNEKGDFELTSIKPEARK